MNNKKKGIQFYILIAIGMMMFFASSCKKDEATVKKDPIITWSNPTDITVGTLLSATQLNATADVAGTFVYTPPIGTTLSVGANQDLKVDFTPSDLSAYNVASKTVKINIVANSTPTNIQTVNIPAGTFIMGSPSTEVNRMTNETQYSVTLSAFRISKYEVTNAQYAAFLNAKGIGSNGLYAAGAYPTQALIYSSSGSYDWGLHYNTNKWEPVAGYENNPVIEVTWYGATEFATYAGGTLPTEAQWEYACRAGTSTPFNTGNFLTNLQANYDWAWPYPYNSGTNTVTTCPGKTQAVGTYAANAWGLHDMHGNVWEWCSDWYGTYPTTAQTNPTGAATGSYRVYRGGSWGDNAMFCRSALRNDFIPNNSRNYLGFRVVFVP
ncbi:MAG: formylglycine-generating enzyme family protein [Bacteroidales bacterium]|nr:formylglycine-generating enzyme family protein [Bacteroidales bacterium]